MFEWVRKTGRVRTAQRTHMHRMSLSVLRQAYPFPTLQAHTEILDSRRARSEPWHCAAKVRVSATVSSGRWFSVWLTYVATRATSNAGLLLPLPLPLPQLLPPCMGRPLYRMAPYCFSPPAVRRGTSPAPLSAVAAAELAPNLGPPTAAGVLGGMSCPARALRRVERPAPGGPRRRVMRPGRSTPLPASRITWRRARRRRGSGGRSFLPLIAPVPASLSLVVAAGVFLF